MSSAKEHFDYETPEFSDKFDEIGHYIDGYNEALRDVFSVNKKRRKTMKLRGLGQIRLSCRAADNLAFSELGNLRNRNVASLTKEDAKVVKACAQRSFKFIFGKRARRELNEITQCCFMKIGSEI